MRITLESSVKDEYTTKVIIETASDDLTIYQVMEDLVQPVLIAYGYSPELVKEELGFE